MEEGIFVSDFNKIIRDKYKLPERVYIFDTTLRDGEQTPSVCFTYEEKLDIARKLDEMGVDIIEGGFPINSEEEERTVRDMKKMGLRAKICGLARCTFEDIDACIRADVDRIHIFIATSDIHLKYKLRMNEEEALKQAIKCTEYVKAHGFECEFSCEDATRTPLERLIKFYKSVEECGADIHNVPDTVGVMEPEAMFYLISELKKVLKKPISVHCHNDFGLAVANTVAGVKAGAEQVHTTINGLGERAGNASMEQTVMILTAMYKIKTGIKLRLLKETSRLVEKYSMIKLMPNFPIVGDNAFAHEAGIHVHGVLAKAESYEPITPEMVGQKRRIVMGKHTGKHAVAAFVKERFNLPDEKIKEVVEKVKKLAVHKKKIIEDDVIAIVDEVIGTIPEVEKIVKLDEVLIITGNKITPTASVQITIGDTKKIVASTGIGPVDAAAKAIQNAIEEKITLLNYKLEAISGGTDSLCTVEVLLEDKQGRNARGIAVGGDIVMTSINAIMDGINKIFRMYR
jgi:2-isopropylmalate synthase